MERCFGTGDPLYEHYHDHEWGYPVADPPDEAPLFERLALEGFQSGLSWLIVLRKREQLRAAFAGFAPQRLARFGEAQVQQLLANPKIIRNQAKIRAVISNSRALLALHESGLRLRELMAEHAPPHRLAPPASPAEIPSQTTGSLALSKRLKGLGFKFVGPVTLYATFQAVGFVDDHLASCWRNTPDARPH